MAFLPPTAEQINSLSDLVTLIKGASDEGVQAVIAQMKEQSVIAQQARADAAAGVNEANAKLAQAQELVDSVAALKASLEKKEKDQEASSFALDERSKQLAADVKQLAADAKAQAKDLKTREGELAAREAAIAEREQVADAKAQLADSTIADYEAKIAALKTITG